MNRKIVIIVVLIVLVIVLVASAFIINLVLFNNLKNNKIDVTKLKGISTNSTLEIESDPSYVSKQKIEKINFGEKRKYMYGIFSLGFKVDCTYDAGDKLINFELYEVDCFRTYAEDAEGYYIFAGRGLFETQYIVKMRYEDSEYLLTILSCLGFPYLDHLND